MKKFYPLFIAAMCGLLLTSCDQKGKEFEIPEKAAKYLSHTYGFWGPDLFDVVPGKYCTYKDGDDIYIDVKVKVTDNKLSDTYVLNRVEKFILAFGDINEKPLVYNPKGDSNYGLALGDTAMVRKLMDCKEGENKTVRFTCTVNNSADADLLLNNVALFSIELDVDADKKSDLEKASKEEEESTAEDTSASSSEDWDEVLDSYEEFVNEYIKLMKQVSAGDMNAYSEITTYTEKLTELGNKLDAASDDITPAQLARYNKISMKMATAAQ